MSVGCSHVQVLGSSSYYLEHKISLAAPMKKWHGKNTEKETILLIMGNTLQDQKYKHFEKPCSCFALGGEEHQSPDLPQWHTLLSISSLLSSNIILQ